MHFCKYRFNTPKDPKNVISRKFLEKPETQIAQICVKEIVSAIFLSVPLVILDQVGHIGIFEATFCFKKNS